MSPRSGRDLILQAGNRPHQPFRQREHDEDEEDAEDQSVVQSEAESDLVEADHGERAEHRTQEVPASAQNGRHDELCREGPAELMGRHLAVDLPGEAAGQPREHARKDERVPPEPAHPDPDEAVMLNSSRLLRHREDPGLKDGRRPDYAARPR